MATRRARIKAIVNVPARRSKLNEEPNQGSKPNKLPESTDLNNSTSSLSDKNTSVSVQDVIKNDSLVKEFKTEEVLLPSSNVQPSLEGNDRCPVNDKSVTEVSNECQSDELITSNNIDKPVESLPIPTKDPENENCDNEDGKTSASKSSLEESIGDNLIEKGNNESLKAKEMTPHNSPLKQRPRLFIRPSPKLDAGGRRRIPSGTRHKASSESEEETKSRTTVVEDNESQPAEISSRCSISLQEKASKPQETPPTNSSEPPSGDAKKNSSRSGRQRARNKENRASDVRRRLLHQMKKGGGTGSFDRTRLTMFDYIYYNPISNPMRSSSESSVSRKSGRESIGESTVNNALSEEQVDDPGEGGSLLEGDDGKTKDTADKETDEQEEESGVPAPRVKVGPDGELILDEQSLVIETTGLKEGLQDLAKGPALVESSSFTNYATYSKRSKGHDWSETDTLRFYRALNVVGTDFTLMQSVLFPKRSRRDLKNKFKREERRNSSLIEKALRYPGAFSSVEELQSEFAKKDPEEVAKTESKRGRGRGKGRGGRGTAAKKESSPPKKKRRKKYIVNGNESDGDESESEDKESVKNDKKSDGNDLIFESSKEKSPEVGHLSSPIIYNASNIDDEILMTMGSQEIVETNEDTTNCSNAKERTNKENGVQKDTVIDDDSDENECASNESQFFSRVFQPTRSGRVPKRREVNNTYQNEHKKKALLVDQWQDIKPVIADGNSNIQPSKPKLKTEVIVCSKEAEEGISRDMTKQPLSIELTQYSSTQSMSAERIQEMEPGSLVVISTCAPDDPSRQVLQLFMVSPKTEGQGSLLIPQNLSSGYKLEAVQEDNEQRFVSASIVPVENSSEEISVVQSVNNPSEGITSCSSIKVTDL